MIYSRTALLCLSGFFLVACEPSGEMSASDEPVAENGSSEAMETMHDLTSFNAVGDAEWNIIDDYVEADGYTGSFLVTRGHYTDFVLQAEF